MTDVCGIPIHVFICRYLYREKQTTQSFIILQVCIMYMQYAIVYIFVLPLCKCFTNSEFVKMV